MQPCVDNLRPYHSEVMRRGSASPGSVGFPLRGDLFRDCSPLAGGNRGVRRADGQGNAARRVYQRWRRQHPRHHQGDGDPVGRGWRYSRLRDYLRASQPHHCAAHTLAQAANPRCANHHGLRRIQPGRRRYNGPSIGPQADSRRRRSGPTHCNSGRASVGDHAAPYSGLHRHRPTPHRY